MPDPTPNLEQAIADNAAGPAKASVDGQSVEQHAIRDQIEADRYLESKRATRRRGRGIRRFKIVGGGGGGAGGTGGREGGC